MKFISMAAASEQRSAEQCASASQLQEWAGTCRRASTPRTWETNCSPCGGGAEHSASPNSSWTRTASTESNVPHSPVPWRACVGFLPTPACVVLANCATVSVQRGILFCASGIENESRAVYDCQLMKIKHPFKWASRIPGLCCGN